MNIRFTKLLVLAAAIFALPVAGTYAAPPGEVYPPHDVILQLQPLACIQPTGGPVSLNGTVDGFENGTNVTITATLNGAPFGSPIVVPVADLLSPPGNFHAAFSIPIPAGTQGTLEVTATGIKADTKAEFSVSSTIQLVLCVLPPTGSNHVKEWITYAGLAVMGGIFLVVAARRRRHHAGVAS